MAENKKAQSKAQEKGFEEALWIPPISYVAVSNHPNTNTLSLA